MTYLRDKLKAEIKILQDLPACEYMEDERSLASTIGGLNKALKIVKDAKCKNCANADPHSIWDESDISYPTLVCNVLRGDDYAMEKVAVRPDFGCHAFEPREGEQ